MWRCSGSMRCYQRRWCMLLAQDRRFEDSEVGRSSGVRMVDYYYLEEEEDESMVVVMRVIRSVR